MNDNGAYFISFIGFIIAIASWLLFLHRTEKYEQYYHKTIILLINVRKNKKVIKNT